MITQVDLAIASIMNNKIGFPENRIVYGQLEVARKWWARYNSEEEGVAMNPFMSFFRRVRFHDGNKFAYKPYIRDHEELPIQMDFMYCYLDYVIDIVDGNNIAEGEGGVVGQTEYIKKYMFWMGFGTSFTVADDDGIVWPFRIIPEDPEDNSDLEAFEERGEILRTTFNFRVECYLTDREESSGVIEEIHQRIHNYSGDVDESKLVSDTTITE